VIDKGKFNLLGVTLSAVDYGVMDNEHRHRLNGLELIVPDGQPVRWALNWLHGTKLRDRVYGPNLMLKTCEAAAEQGISIFLFGGKQELLDDLQASLLKQFPKLKIAGMLASKFRTVSVEEKREIVTTIRESGASIAMVGLGCPRQEVWAYEFKNELEMPVLAVGAAFNFHAGQLAQAPAWMQRLGLEWFFRLLKEPTRLWHRYLVLNPYYLSLVFLQLTGLKKFDPETTDSPKQEILYG